jgi:hypothetical protein
MVERKNNMPFTVLKPDKRANFEENIILRISILNSQWKNGGLCGIQGRVSRGYGSHPK